MLVGMGTSWAEKTASGRWQARFRDDDGKRHGAGSFDTKRQAQNAAAVALANHDPSSNPRFADVADEWLATRHGVAKSTRKTNETHLNARILPYFGTTRVQDITPVMMDDFVAHLVNSGYSPNSVGHTMATVKMVMERALRSGHIRFNPARGVKLPSPGRSPDRYITREQYNAIMEALPAHTYSRPFTDILVGTGLRVGELRALHWENVDFGNELIHVTMAFNDSTKQIKDVKNHADRSVPIAPPVRSALLQMKHVGNFPGVPAFGVEYLIKPMPTTGPVFVTRRGTLGSIDVIRREWAAACRVARVDGRSVGPVRLQDLRHTAASWMAQDGISLERVQLFLGHESIKTTQRYARFGAQDWSEAKAILTYRGESVRDFYYDQQDRIARGELSRDSDGNGDDD